MTINNTLGVANILKYSVVKAVKMKCYSWLQCNTDDEL